ncbi:MAG: TonB-dependent receptor [Pseudomonadota bacterium]|nr:TonB-dependent receptor [Pseudomonadota bacterium]
MTLKKCLIKITSIATLFFFSLSAFAQVDEITVTARKKEESLQDVPLAISAFDSDEISRKGIDSFDDVAKNTAGLVFDQGITSQDTRVVIRGLSPTRGRQNIAFLQDNIDISSEAISTAGGSLLVNPKYLDFERIEVIKGPQSALYGRAAFNGAVNYVTKDPGDFWEYEIKTDSSTAAGSNNDEHSITIAGGGPITDSFGIRGSATYWDEDGYYNNPFTADENLGGGDGFGVSLKGKWSPSDILTVRGRIGYSDDQYEQRPAAFLPYNTLSFFPEEAITYQWVNKEFLGGDPQDFLNYNYEICGDAFAPGGAPTSTPNAITSASDCASKLNPGSSFFDPDDPLDPNDSYIVRGGNTRVKGALFTAPVASFGGRVPDSDELNVALSPDPATFDPNGINLPQDYPGTGIEVLRATFDLSWDTLGGNISMWAGYTDAKQDVLIDFDKFAAGPDSVHAALFQSETGPGPDGVLGTIDDIPCSLSGGDCSWGTQQIDFTTDTTQENFEVRYSSENEGMFNYTVGALYWHELTEQLEYSTTARSSGGLFPFAGGAYPNAAGGTRTNCYSPDAGPIAGVGMQTYMSDWAHLKGEFDDFAVGGIGTNNGVSIPDGNNLLCPPTSSDILQYLDDRAIIQPRLKSAETDHWSVYAMLDFELTDTLTFAFEGRYTNELEQQIQPILDPSDPEYNVRQSPSSIQPNCGYSNDSPLPPDPDDPNSALSPICGPTIPAYTPISGPWISPSTLGMMVSTRTDFFTPRATLEWRPADQQMYYLSYAVGKKPGGFSRLTSGSGGFNADESLFTEEKLKVYELGTKVTLFDNRLQINSALFLQDFTDKQVGTTVINFTTGLSTAAIENAGKAEIKGLELDLNWAATDRLDLGLSYSYLDGVFKDFVIESSSSNDLVRNSSRVYLSDDPIIGQGDYRIGDSCFDIFARSAVDSGGDPTVQLLCNIDLSGNQLEDLPKHSLNLNAMYRAPFLDTGLEWYASGEFVYQDERYLEQSNDQFVDEYHFVDARLGLAADNWEAILYVNNLFDDDTVRSAQTGPGIATGNFITGPPIVRNQVIAYPAPPRVYGLRFSFFFGE